VPTGSSLAGVRHLVGVIAGIALRPPVAWARFAGSLPFLRLREILFFVETNENVFALTLDDGPDPEVTPRVLDALARHESHATFFVLGSRAERHPDLIRRILAEGHEIGNHTWDDERSILLATDRFEKSLSSTHNLLVRFGQPVDFFRPGGGWTNSGIIDVARRYGYLCVLGSLYPNDVHIPFSRFIVWDVLRRACPGAIVILHEGTPERMPVVDILGALLPRLAEQGYRVTTVSDLLRARKRTGPNR
jgi:peptidoglycan/xylan/chitin deacetylase (PgdA/CDA1 family)